MTAHHDTIERPSVCFRGLPQHLPKFRSILELAHGDRTDEWKTFYRSKYPVFLECPDCIPMPLRVLRPIFGRAASQTFLYSVDREKYKITGTKWILRGRIWPIRGRIVSTLPVHLLLQTRRVYPVRRVVFLDPIQVDIPRAEPDGIHAHEPHGHGIEPAVAHVLEPAHDLDPRSLMQILPAVVRRTA